MNFRVDVDAGMVMQATAKHILSIKCLRLSVFYCDLSCDGRVTLRLGENGKMDKQLLFRNGEAFFPISSL